jgi:hypothetical protein
MQPISRCRWLAASLLLLAPLHAQDGAPGSQRRDARPLGATPDRAPTAFERRVDYSLPAVPQIRAHLLDVVEALGALDVAHLSPELAARRSQHLVVLTAYAHAGVFPQNDVLPYPTPVFIDRAGRACAVGHLMIESGARELAERIAADELTGYVPELQTPGILEWISASGLTAEECARIQPTYGPCQDWFNESYLWAYSESCHPSTPNSTGWFPQFWAICGDGQATGQTRFVIANLPDDTMVMLLNAPLQGSAPNPFGAGTLCLAGPIGRAPTMVSRTNNWSSCGQWWYPCRHQIVLDHGALPRPGGFQQILAGETWNFQAWYRDAGSSDLTSMVSITYH